MNREEAARAAKLLGASPAAAWIGNKLVGGVLHQMCMRCGAEQSLELPAAVVGAFQTGSRGDALASAVPPDFDEKIFAWKRDFQFAHEGCLEGAA